MWLITCWNSCGCSVEAVVHSASAPLLGECFCAMIRDIVHLLASADANSPFAVGHFLATMSEARSEFNKKLQAS